MSSGPLRLVLLLPAWGAVHQAHTLPSRCATADLCWPPRVARAAAAAGVALPPRHNIGRASLCKVAGLGFIRTLSLGCRIRHHGNQRKWHAMLSCIATLPPTGAASRCRFTRVAALGEAACSTSCCALHVRGRFVHRVEQQPPRHLPAFGPLCSIEKWVSGWMPQSTKRNGASRAAVWGVPAGSPGVGIDPTAGNAAACLPRTGSR